MTATINTAQVIDALSLLQQRLTPAGMQSVYHEIGNDIAHNITLNLGGGLSPEVKTTMVKFFLRCDDNFSRWQPVQATRHNGNAENGRNDHDFRRVEYQQ